MVKLVKSLLRGLLPRRVANHRILGGPLKGKRIVTSWYDYPSAILGYNERPLLDWFARNVSAGETWLDVGAHFGYTALALSELVGSGGRVFAFEPLLSTLGCVQQMRRLNGLTQLRLLPFALASPRHIELKELAVTRGMVDSTIQSQEWREAFMIASLDWLWPLICGGNRTIHGIKIDVQGMEIEALSGMSEVLGLQKPTLVLEVHEAVSRQELSQLIADIGYSLQNEKIDSEPSRLQSSMMDNHSYVFRPR